MMRINLLPYRQLQQQRQQAFWRRQLLVAALTGCVAGGVLWGWQYQRLEQQRGRDALLAQALAQLQVQVQTAADLTQQQEALAAQRAAWQAVQAERNMPVRLFNEMGQQLPPGVYLSSLKQSAGSVTLVGVAWSQSQVSQLLSNLGSRSPWLGRPELIEVVANPAAQDSAQASGVRFSLRLALLPLGPG